MALGLPFGWRRAAFGRESGWGPTVFNGFFLGCDHPSVMLLEIGVHEHLGQEDFRWGALGTVILFKLVGAEMKAGRRWRLRARVVELL